MNTVENSLSTIENKLSLQVNLIDTVLGKLRSLFTVDTCKEHMSVFRTMGHAGIMLAAVLGLVAGTVAAIKSDSFVQFLLGFGWLVGILMIDYVSRRFDQTSDALVKSTRSYLSSTIYVDAIALLLMVTSVGIFAAGLFGAIKTGSVAFLLKTGGLSVWMFYMSLITLNAASMLNVEFKAGLKAEEEGVGLLEFNAKSCLLAVPFYFGSGVVFGLIHLVWNLVQATKDGEPFAVALSDSTPFFIGLAIIAALPFLACVAFLVLYACIAAVKSLIRTAAALEKKEA